MEDKHKVGDLGAEQSLHCPAPCTIAGVSLKGMTAAEHARERAGHYEMKTRGPLFSHH